MSSLQGKDTKLNGFWPKIDIVVSCQKLGIILGNKVFQKISITKTVLLNWHFLNQKDSNGSWHWKLTLKNQILSLFDNSALYLFTKYNNFLWVCWFVSKNLSNFAPLPFKLDNPYYLLSCTVPCQFAARRWELFALGFINNQSTKLIFSYITITFFKGLVLVSDVKSNSFGCYCFNLGGKYFMFRKQLIC